MRAPLLIVAALLALGALAVTAVLLTMGSPGEPDGATAIEREQRPDRPQRTEQPARERYPAGGRDVAGTVTNDRGYPLRGATVEAGEMTTTTDDDGRFLLTGVSPRVREIVVRADGVATKTIPIGRRDELVTAKLHRVRRVDVSVELPDGLVPAGGRLMVRPWRTEEHEVVLEADGTHPPLELIHRLTRITFPAQRVGGVPLQRAQTSVSASGNKPATLRPERGAAISGRVLDPDGRPVKSALVQARRYESGKFPIRDSAETDSNGWFEVIIDPGAKTSLRTITQSERGATGFRFATSIVQAEAGDSNLEIRLKQGLTTTGAVELPDGTPARRVRLAVTRNSRRPGGGTSEVGTTVVTDSDGRFRIGGLIQGYYWIDVPPDVAEAKNWVLRTELCAGSTDVVLPISKSLRVSGTLLDERGEPVYTMNLTLNDGKVGRSLRSRTNRSGEFVVKGVPPGEYTASATVPGRSGWVSLGTVRAGSEDVELRVPPAR